MGDHINYSKKKFQLIHTYFNDKKYISLKELIEYKHYLYKKSRKENDKLQFGVKEWTVVLVEMSMIYTLLSNDKGLSLAKLEKVFEHETLDNVKINPINLLNISKSFIESTFFWLNSSIKNRK